MAKASLKRSERPIEAPAAPVVMGKEEADRWPLLYAHLTQSLWDDGGARQTSTLLIFSEGPALKMCLHDREHGLVCFLAVAGIVAGLSELEEGLSAESLEWRKKKVFNGRAWKE